MPFDPNAVGTPLPQADVEISTRALLAYAAGLGATEEVFFDDLREGGIIGLPQFTVSPEWKSRASLEQIGLSAVEAVRGVHAVQDSFFHRPFRPGMKLRVGGIISGIYQSRAGMRMVSKFEVVDRDSGAPVTTSFSAGVFRGVSMKGPEREIEAPPEVPKLDVDPTDCDTVEIPIPREMPHTYTECADIWNPIHTEREVALRAGLPDIILHGTATWALAGLEVLRRRADCNPLRLKRLHARFTGMVIPGTTIHVQVGQIRGGVVPFQVQNDARENVLSNGIAELD